LPTSIFLNDDDDDDDNFQENMKDFTVIKADTKMIGDSMLLSKASRKL